MRVSVRVVFPCHCVCACFRLLLLRRCSLVRAALQLVYRIQMSGYIFRFGAVLSLLFTNVDHS